MGSEAPLSTKKLSKGELPRFRFCIASSLVTNSVHGVRRLRELRRRFYASFWNTETRCC